MYVYRSDNLTNDLVLLLKMPSASVQELQQKLLKRIGIDVPVQGQSHRRKGLRTIEKSMSRKEQRKLQRTKNNSQRNACRGHSTRPHPPSQSKTKVKKLPSQHIFLKRASPLIDAVTGDIEAANKAVDYATSELGEDDAWDSDDGFDGENESDGEDADGVYTNSTNNALGDARTTVSNPSSRSGGLSRVVQNKLALDDAEIDHFERKLGIKKGRTSLPQAFKEDGLDKIIGELQDNSVEGENETAKRKRDYDEWLSFKRQKKSSGYPIKPGDANGNTSGSMVEKGSETSLSDIDNQSFDGFGYEDEPTCRNQKRQRENPYVAPTAEKIMTKYVPPSLRVNTGSESVSKARLQRQIQGLTNRLTEANILTIVQSMENLYQTNARGDVTELLIEAILAQMLKPESMPDQFFVLIGGFSAAMYKVTGSSFGSHLIRHVVKSFNDEYTRATGLSGNSSMISKQSYNIIGYLSQLYVFEVLSCKVMFDYIERFLADLNELNVELLVRVCRMAGRLLRRDDPQALKHVTTILAKAVGNVGYNNVSARTKFMIETINDLKNSKPKARGIDSDIVSEHVSRMKKRLGELKSQSRRLDGLAPMGMGLQDIEDADTRGKWWLVGASVPANITGHSDLGDRKKLDDNHLEVSDDEDMDFVLPDYPRKARAQGFNTAAQMAIFTALMSAMDYEHGCQQITSLGLKKDDQLEIARVLVRCVGSEAKYNEYYALVANQACTNSRVRFALQDRLWKLFRSLGEQLFGEEALDEETGEGERMKDARRLSNVARFYAALVAYGTLDISILKPLNIPEINSWTSLFVEWLIISLLRECRGGRSKEETMAGKSFGPAARIPSLSVGIHWFLRKKVPKSGLIESKEMKKLDRVRTLALAAVQEVVLG